MAFKVPLQHRQPPHSPTTAGPSSQQPSHPLEVSSPQKQNNQTSSRHISALHQSTSTLQHTPVSDDREEWVVFAPSTIGATTARTQTSGLLSRISDFGSFSAGGGDYDEEEDEEDEGGYDDDERLGSVEEEDEDDEEDDDDIDLGGFRDPFHNGPVMLPTHDGMGTFQTRSPQRSTEESTRFIPLTVENSFTHNRIQAWRLEQSRILLDEIERVTRKRLSMKMTERERREEEEVTMSHVGVDDIITEKTAEGATANPIQETFWRKLTRKVMQDIMGLDDMVLQVIFGESLPPGFEESDSSNGSDAEDLKKIDDSWQERFLERLGRELGAVVNQYTTQHPTVSAFSTYTRGRGGELANSSAQMRSSSTPPLGLPILAPSRSTRRQQQQNAAAASLPRQNLYSYEDALFEPTLRQLDSDDIASHAASWGIEERPGLELSTSDARLDADIAREYWEKELNLRMFFSFLKSRFASVATESAEVSQETSGSQAASSTAQSSSSTAVTPTSSNSTSTTTHRSSGHKYATSANHTPVHRHHPLIHRQHHQQRHGSRRLVNNGGGIAAHTGASVSKTHTPRHSGLRDSVSSAISFGFPGFGSLRSGSSCASETTKRSANTTTHRRNPSQRSSSSRHYWEVATSVGSGRSSCVGVGAWAEI